VVDRLPPARRGRRPAKQLAWAAVRRRRVPADADLEVLDETGAQDPIAHRAEFAVGHRVGEQADPQRGIGAFQIRPKVWLAGEFVNVATRLSRTAPRCGARSAPRRARIRSRAGPGAQDSRPGRSTAWRSASDSTPRPANRAVRGETRTTSGWGSTRPGAGSRAGLCRGSRCGGPPGARPPRQA